MATPGEIIKKIRDELGMVQSSALLMAHAHGADTRVRYLKTVGEKINSINSLLDQLQAAGGPQS
jgi:hypothetical protein